MKFVSIKKFNIFWSLNLKSNRYSHFNLIMLNFFDVFIHVKKLNVIGLKKLYSFFFKV